MDRELEMIFAQRKPRVDTLVLIRDGKTEFVPRSDIIDWEKKQRFEAVRGGFTAAGIMVAAVAGACLLTRTGNAWGWWTVIAFDALIAGSLGIWKDARI